MPELRLELVTTEERLRSLSEAWSSLLTRSAQDEPTLTPTWILSWWKLFSPLDRRSLRVCALWQEDHLVALAPLLCRTRRHRGVLPLRRLEFLCSGEAQADEIHSEYLGIVVERGFEQDAARSFAAAIAQGRLGEVDECGLHMMNADDPVPPLFCDELHRLGWVAGLSQISEAPYVSLPSSWEDYLGGLQARKRRVIRRAEADLTAWAGQPLRLHVAGDKRSLARGQDILKKLHAGRWGATEHEGVFASRRFTAFHEMVMPLLLGQGALELMWLEARGAPLAAVYNLVWNQKVYHYQAGRAIDLPSRLRPGFAMHAHAIRHAIEAGRAEYDFLGGADRYKRDWAPAARGLLALSALRPGNRSRLRSALDRWWETARRLRPRSA